MPRFRIIILIEPRALFDFPDASVQVDMHDDREKDERSENQ